MQVIWSGLVRYVVRTMLFKILSGMRMTLQFTHFWKLSWILQMAGTRHDLTSFWTNWLISLLLIPFVGNDLSWLGWQRLGGIGDKARTQTSEMLQTWMYYFTGPFWASCIIIFWLWDSVEKKCLFVLQKCFLC